MTGPVSGASGFGGSGVGSGFAGSGSGSAFGGAVAGPGGSLSQSSACRGGVGRLCQETPKTISAKKAACTASARMTERTLPGWRGPALVPVVAFTARA